MLLALIGAALAEPRVDCGTDEDCLAACERGDWDACVWYARMTASNEPWHRMTGIGLGPRRRPSSGPSFAAKVLGCEAGDRDSCEFVDEWWRWRPPGMFLGTRALHACREGIEPACDELYDMEQYGWLPGHLDELEHELCQAAYTKACPLDARPALAESGLTSCLVDGIREPEHVEACAGKLRGWAFESPVGATMRVRCGSGDLESCLWLLTHGWRVHADPAENAAARLALCVAEGGACEELRRPLPPWLCSSDRDCAARCARGDARSCGRTRLFDQERFHRARRLVLAGCEANHARSCAAALEVDAREQVTRFCENGVFEACVALHVDPARKRRRRRPGGKKR